MENNKTCWTEHHWTTVTEYKQEVIPSPRYMNKYMNAKKLKIFPFFTLSDGHLITGHLIIKHNSQKIPLVFFSVISEIYHLDIVLIKCLPWKASSGAQLRWLITNQLPFFTHSLQSQRRRVVSRNASFELQDTLYWLVDDVDPTNQWWNLCPTCNMIDFHQFN